MAAIIRNGDFVPGGTNIPAFREISYKPFQEPSLFRIIRHIFWSVMDGLKTLWAKYQPLIDAKKVFINREIDIVNSPGNKIDGAVINYLKDKTQDVCNFVTDFYITGSVSANIVDGRPIAIPVVLHSIFGNHIVCFYVDPEQKQIEFFDSMGLTVHDRGNASVCGPKTTLLEVANLIYETFGQADWQIHENDKKMQFDRHNCGIYVYDFLQRRINKETWEDIQQNPLSFQAASHDRRRAIMDDILDLQKSQETEPEETQVRADVEEDGWVNLTQEEKKSQ